MTTTHDLGHGWFANLTRTHDGQTLMIRNANTGKRIDLNAKSVETLRDIFAKVEN